MSFQISLRMFQGLIDWLSYNLGLFLSTLPAFQLQLNFAAGSDFFFRSVAGSIESDRKVGTLKILSQEAWTSVGFVWGP